MNFRDKIVGLPVFRLTWNMGDDGVVTIYARDVNGQAMDFADIFRRPRRRALGVSEEKARDMQVAAAEAICRMWNETVQPPHVEEPAHKASDNSGRITGDKDCENAVGGPQ